MLSLPSPDVSARSANAGPNVVAARTSRPVLGSSLIRKPPVDAPYGVVAIPSCAARARASPTCAVPTGVTIWLSVLAIVVVSTVVVTPGNGGGGWPGGVGVGVGVGVGGLGIGVRDNAGALQIRITASAH